MGEYVGLAAVKEHLLQFSRQELKLQTEREMMGATTSARTLRNAAPTVKERRGPKKVSSLPDLGPTPADAIYKRVEVDVGAIRKVVEKLAILKGTFVRKLKEATALIMTEDGGGYVRTGTQEAEILKLENTYMRSSTG